MADVMKTQVSLDARMFWKLAAIAERYDMRVDEYLVELAAIAANRKVPATVSPVGKLWKEGLSDSAIGAELNWTNAAVADHRRGLGLSPNKGNR